MPTLPLFGIASNTTTRISGEYSPPLTKLCPKTTNRSQMRRTNGRPAEEATRPQPVSLAERGSCLVDSGVRKGFGGTKAWQGFGILGK